MQLNKYVTDIKDAGIHKAAADFVAQYRTFEQKSDKYTCETGFKTITLKDKQLKSANIYYQALKQVAAPRYAQNTCNNYFIVEF